VSPRFLPLALVLALVAAPLGAQHRPGAHSGGRPRASHPRSYSSRPKPPAASPRAQREHRSQAAKHEFMRRSGHPHGWPGHVVDHIVPLACGGADEPGNMEWQTVEEAKAKDKWERTGCAARKR
jgi:hypothetical protein